MIPIRRLVVAALLATGAGCGAPGRQRAPGGRSDAASGQADDSAGGAPRTASGPAILFLGTSLTAGLGLDPGQAYAALIQRKLDSAGLGWRAVNGGVSGETSAGALRRLEWVLEPDVRVLVIETGANDGLRGLDVDSTRANLDAIVRLARAKDPGIRLVLAGMEAPPNLGAGYTERFRALFRDLARRERIPLIPFLLAGVAGVDSLNQADGIHPNVRGERVVAETVWKALEPVLKDETHRRTDAQMNVVPPTPGEST